MRQAQVGTPKQPIAATVTLPLSRPAGDHGMWGHFAAQTAQKPKEPLARRRGALLGLGAPNGFRTRVFSLKG